MSDEGQKYDGVLKLILSGNSFTGKTQFIERLKNREFDPDSVATFGVNLEEKFVQVGNKTAKVQLWDPSGSENFLSVVPNYYRGVHGVLLFYDISNLYSFKDIERCLYELYENTRSQEQDSQIANETVQMLIYDESQCSICLSKDPEVPTGCIHCGKHVGCMECVVRWTHTRSVCPFCKKRWVSGSFKVMRTSQDIKNIGIPIILIGNKCDLEAQREVLTLDANDYAINNRLLFIETSASSNANVEKAFSMIVDKILEQNPRILNAPKSSLALIGDSGVGKSNLISCFMYKRFNMEIRSTIGIGYEAKNVQINGKTIKACIWDTSGQERFRAITQNHYRDALGALVVYDIANYETFESAKHWVYEVRNKSGEETVIILVGNKSDLARAVKFNDANIFADKHNLLFIETSAMKSTNVEKAFKILLTKIYETLPHDRLETLNQKTGNVALDNKESAVSGGGCCSIL